jgi:hypothetical protein
MQVTRMTAVVLAGLLATAAACGGDDKTSSASNGGNGDSAPPSSVIDPGKAADYHPKLDPADFVATVDNPYWPLTTGSRWVFDGRDDGDVEHVEVVVTDRHKEILGIPATVVRDTVKDEDGTLVEDTFDWYAQDKDGNVWYLGEDSTEYENGKAHSTKGSWEAGVGGAYPGIVMPADPTAGKAYRQEYDKGNAEDMAEVQKVGAGPETVPAGTYRDLVVIKEWNPLEPDVVEVKTYAPGVGVVLEEKVEGGTGRSELTEATVTP